ncbi:Glutathione S-transferase Mu 2 [Chionoecetes opilio]|uniref:glutathione transferase n=1 Tax=Chionoecetes opilio TaxID=41210 RepID=A0A8J4XUF2_CHIOP|nr:Glutathione S-transferase Mu 2 [Chionoecetes opilio]
MPCYLYRQFMMLRLCVAVTLVVAAVCRQWSMPSQRSMPPQWSMPLDRSMPLQRSMPPQSNLLPALAPRPLKFSPLRPWYGAKAKRTSSSVSVVWLAHCSPRQAFIRRKQDAQLQCEAVVPEGTEVTWYKNHQPLQRLGQQMTDIQQEVYEETTNVVGSPPVAAQVTSATRLRLASVVFIDCADQEDEAEYSLEMRLPTNNVYSRNFTVRLLDMRQEGSTCNLEASQLEQLPRIYQHAPTAWATAGGSLTLPCRAQGRHLQHTWYVDNTYVGNTNPNHQVLPNGDLIIRAVGTQAPSSCRCEVSSTEAAGPMDAITTTVRLGQYIRMLMEYTGMEYEEKLYTKDSKPSWPEEKFKLGLDFPNLPYYKDGDIKITQSVAIMYHIGRKHNMIGGTEAEKTQVDMLVQQAIDMRLHYAMLVYGDYENKKDEYLSDKLPMVLKMLEEYLGSKTWVMGEQITIPDFIFYEVLDINLLLQKSCLDKYKNLRCFHKRFEALPAIKKYMASPRFIKSPISGPDAKIGNE